MSILTGILVDVSVSMSANASVDVNEEGGEWIQSIFSVIDGLVKHDVSAKNHVFVVAFGTPFKSGILDVLGTVNDMQIGTHQDGPTFDQIIENTFSILEDNGAYHVRRWAEVDVIKEAISYAEAFWINEHLKTDSRFVEIFVNKCLPRICRDLVHDQRDKVKGKGKKGRRLVKSAKKVCRSAFLKVQKAVASSANVAGISASKEDINDVVVKAKCVIKQLKVKQFEYQYQENDLIPSSWYKRIGSKQIDSECIVSAPTASKIIHGCIREKELSSERVKELMKTVKPFIYGRTPLFKALDKATQLFNETRYISDKKLLFVLSDGEPTDNGCIDRVINELKVADVTVVSCFISQSPNIEPQRLYSSPEMGWDNGAQLMFKLSSAIPTQLLPRTIFIKRGWKIDIIDNETKLFLQVNHPTILNDACNLARNVVCCQDSLSDILGSVYLDVYINQSTERFEAREQKGSTCYANSSAAVLHLAMKRIIGREGGYPDFETLRHKMIMTHGHNGANPLLVLQSICPAYRLNCRSVDVIVAMEAVTAKRPVVASFWLTDKQWDNFTDFYRKDPKGILRKKDMNENRSLFDSKTVGHSVVLTSYSSECLRLLNSWGDNWADMGFFRVENAAVLNLEFVDVYWTENDLTEKEKEYYQKYGADVAAALMQSLKGLQKADYKCPLCRSVSFVTAFTGTLLKAVCPKCHGTFISSDKGNILAMNMYLLSLTR